jgi:hypothetical protein
MNSYIYEYYKLLVGFELFRSTARDLSFFLSNEGVIYSTIVYSLILFVILPYVLYRFSIDYLKGLKLKKNLHHDDLREIGLFRQKFKTSHSPTGQLQKILVSEFIQVEKQDNYYAFKKYNKKFCVDDFERLRPNLEHIFNIEISLINSLHQKYGQPEVRVYFNAYPEVLEMDSMPNLSPWQIWFGLNGLKENIIIDTKNDFKNCWLILSPKGGGKSILIRGIIHSFFKKFPTKIHDLIIIDGKGTDFIDFKKKHGAKIYDPTDLNQFRSIVNLLENYIKELDQFRLLLQEKEIQVNHWNDLDGIIETPTPLFIVFDEFSDYCSKPSNPIKETKEMTLDQREQLERQKLIIKISGQLNKLAKLYRPTGTILIGSSQDSRSTQYLLDFTNFKDMILSRQNQTQSTALCGDSKIATSGDLRDGRFIYVSEKVEKFQAPFYRLPKINLEKIKTNNEKESNSLITKEDLHSSVIAQ